MAEHTLLQVDWPSSGRLNLKETAPGESFPHDLKGPLFGNKNAAEFYRAVAAYMGDLAAKGIEFRYSDTSAATSDLPGEA